MIFADVRNPAKRLWIWVFVLTTVTALWPVGSRITRLTFVLGAAAIWIGALALWWKAMAIRYGLIAAAACPALALCLPGRPVDPAFLAADYSRSVRSFLGVRYLWGGENFLGIDCSGFVRKGLIWRLGLHGLRTLNGRPIRDALSLWFHDSSARAFRDGYRGWTVELFRAASVESADHSRLRPGDLAVTADGIHIMAYLGNRTWIEADPGANKVIELALPTDNSWFKVPVVFVRWKWLGLAGLGNMNQPVENIRAFEIQRAILAS